MGAAEGRDPGGAILGFGSIAPDADEGLVTQIEGLRWRRWVEGVLNGVEELLAIAGGEFEGLLLEFLEGHGSGRWVAI